ncbi:MAG: hypothetical protein M1838_001059 [Thelocarpon superellum]|nr:MAG: hypothetical protein M1838_001059 [Thelocarpon superellum]
MAWIQISVAVVCVGLAALWLIQPTYDADEPQPIPHIIPILGHGIPFARNRRSFFRWGARQSPGKPWSAYIAGRKHYIFSKQSDLTTVFRKSKVLSLAGFIRYINSYLFGMSSADVVKMDSITESTHHVNSMLLRPSHYNTTALVYYKEVRRLMRALGLEIDASETKSVRKDAFSLVTDVQGTATVTTYFGRKFLALNPNAMREMEDFAADGFWPFLSGLPSFLVGRPGRIRTQIQNNLRKVADTAETEPDVSDYVRAKVKLASANISPEGVAVDEFGFLFGLFSNSTPTAYIMLLRILTIPGLYEAVRAELKAAAFSSLSDEDLVSLIPAGLPLMRSVFFEGQRWHSGSLIMREVVEPTEIVSKAPVPDQEDKVYQLKKGAVVNMPSMLLHFDPDVHPDPETFNPKRFLSPELGGLGASTSAGIRSFGGGVSYCPGRVFAERQVIGFLAFLLSDYDVTFANDTWVMPEGHDIEQVARLPRAELNIARRAKGGS